MLRRRMLSQMPLPPSGNVNDAYFYVEAPWIKDLSKYISINIYIYRIRTHALVYINTVVDLTGRRSPAPKHTPSLSEG